MEEKMKVLIDLQACDARIKNIQRKKAEGPLKIQRLKEELDAIEKQLEEVSNKLDERKGEGRKAEQDIEHLESRVEKSNIKLSNVKSNKEYQAALKEIGDLSQEKSSMEDGILDLMEEIEALEERDVIRKAERDESKERFDKARDEILAGIKAMDEESESLEKERSRLCGGIDEDLLRRYDFLREHKGDLAVSPVIKGVCQTCHLDIPPQKFNELIRGEEIMTCPNCNRIIYLGEDERPKDAVDKG